MNDVKTLRNRVDRSRSDSRYRSCDGRQRAAQQQEDTTSWSHQNRARTRRGADAARDGRKVIPRSRPGVFTLTRLLQLPLTSQADEVGRRAESDFRADFDADSCSLRIRTACGETQAGKRPEGTAA